MLHAKHSTPDEHPDCDRASGFGVVNQLNRLVDKLAGEHVIAHLILAPGPCEKELDALVLIEC